MATPQEFVLPCEKKGSSNLFFHFFHLLSMSAFLAEKQNRYDVYYPLDIQTSLISSQRKEYL